MGFNAGGTNVGGVQQVQQGNLSIDLIDLSITADGAVTNQHTVPAGKRWILKGYRSARASGSFTPGSNLVLISIGGVLHTIYPTSATDPTILLYNDLVLDAGSVVEFRTTISGYATTGNWRSSILVQEINN